MRRSAIQHRIDLTAKMILRQEKGIFSQMRKEMSKHRDKLEAQVQEAARTFDNRECKYVYYDVDPVVQYRELCAGDFYPYVQENRLRSPPGAA